MPQGQHPADLDRPDDLADPLANKRRVFGKFGPLGQWTQQFLLGQRPLPIVARAGVDFIAHPGRARTQHCPGRRLARLELGPVALGGTGMSNLVQVFFSVGTETVDCFAR